MSKDLSGLVSTTIEDAVGTITLAAPEIGNALSIAMAEELLVAVERMAEDPNVRCVLLTGQGRFFCVGGDLKSLHEAGSEVGAMIKRLTDPLHRTVGILLKMDKPLVVAVNGPVAGGGLGLSLTGDIVLAAERAHFSMAYSAIGFSPDGGSSWLLPRLIGLRKAQELALTNRRLSSEEAESLGLITRRVADDELADEAHQVATKLADGARKAFAATRQLLLASYIASPEDQMQAEAKSVRDQAEGPEGREGLVAFIEKRTPDYRNIA